MTMYETEQTTNTVYIMPRDWNVSRPKCKASFQGILIEKKMSFDWQIVREPQAVYALFALFVLMATTIYTSKAGA